MTDPSGTARRLNAAALTAAAFAFCAAACEGPRPGQPPDGPRAADAMAEAPSQSAAPPPAPPPPPPPPDPTLLTVPGPIIPLPVDGHPEAVVSVPIGAAGRRPVVIAAHGNFDRPEWQCQVWRGIVGDAAFVLCPRGVPRSDSPSRDDIRFTYESNQRLEQEIDAGLAALAARFPEHVDPGPVLYTGFSLGAIMGVSIAARRPGRFPRLVLVEGGHDKWTPATAKAFADGGGLRALFVCGQAWCANDAKRAATRLDRARIATKVARSGREVGHTYDGAVAEEARKALPWVLEGDPRW